MELFTFVEIGRSTPSLGQAKTIEYLSLTHKWTAAWHGVRDQSSSF